MRPSKTFELIPGRIFRNLTGMSVYSLGTRVLWLSYSTILLPVCVQSTTSIAQAMASDLMPHAEAKMVMSRSNRSAGVAGAVSPLICGFLLNVRNAPTRISFAWMFCLAAFFYFISSLGFWQKTPDL